MFHILGFLFLILIVILFIGLSIIGTVLRGLFGLGNRVKNAGNRTAGNQSWQSRDGGTWQQPSSSSQGETATEEGELHPKRRKLFSKEDGEYVDFEEIKEP